MTRIRKIAFVSALLFLTIGFAVIFLIKFSNINQKYPEPEVKTYQKGQVLNYNGIELRVTDFTIIEWKDISVLYPEKALNYDPIKYGEISSNDQMKVLLITLYIKNSSPQAKSLSLYTMVAETLTWRNGLNRDLFFDLNDTDDHESSINPFLSSDEELTVTMPYVATQNQLPAKDWAAFDELKFELMFSLYPTKEVFILS